MTGGDLLPAPISATGGGGVTEPSREAGGLPSVVGRRGERLPLKGKLSAEPTDEVLHQVARGMDVEQNA